MSEKINKEFHKWLEYEATGWVRLVAHSTTAYQALRVAFEAGKATNPEGGK